MNRVRIYRRSMLLLAVAVLVAVAGAFAQHMPLGSAPGSGHGGGLGIGSYDTKERPQAARVLTGTVRDKDGNAIKGALVFLKNDKTSATRSMVADEKGEFRFVQLSRIDDYKLWAEHKEKKSEPKVISSFDTKDEISRNLKIE